ncbi:MAG: trypsin-like serine protease [Elusimicrobiaceae bacterium]|nr:trypsin-like serine protease [Elusimicrobiaceae bacterium]
MRKIFIICIFCLSASFIFGEEIFVSEPGNTNGTSCQAVRIKDTWFLTAKHCTDICNISCNVEVNIAGNIFKTSQQNVFWFKNRQGKNASYDIALIDFKNAKIPGSFKEPPIFIIDNSVRFSEPKIINRSLKIPFDINGNIGTVMSINPVFYGPKSQIIFTKDLGIFHGLSGAGVFTDKGELVAITSAAAGQGNNVRFSVFAAFDDKVKEFLSGKGLSLYFKHANSPDFKDITQDKEILISLDNDK